MHYILIFLISIILINEMFLGSKIKIELECQMEKEEKLFSKIDELREG